MMVLGIDPGKKGGYCLMQRGEGVVDVMRMQLTGKDLSIQALVDYIWKAKSETGPKGKLLVVIEKVHSMPAMSSQSVFTFGEGYGKLKGVCEAMKIPYELVTPQAWKKEVLAGTDKTKEAAIAWVKGRYPSVDLGKGGRTDSDGIADAVCIAEYGMRKFT